MFSGMHYVYEVYKEMSFSKAAKNMYISQPSLSAAIKKVEKEVGFPIFDRSTTPIQLTDIGKKYIHSIEQLMDIENSFERYLCDLQDMQIGSISIGGTTLFTSFVLPPLLSRFSELYPNIQVNLVESNTSTLTEKLFSGELDLIIDNQIMDENIFQKKIFCKDYLLLAVPANFSSNAPASEYALHAGDIKAGKHLEHEFPAVPLSLFSSEDFLLLKPGNNTRTRADKILHNSAIVPSVKLELDQQITAYNLAHYGMGIAFCGDVLIKNVPDNTNLIFYKLHEQEAIREVSFYYKKNRYLSNIVQNFLNLF